MLPFFVLKREITLSYFYMIILTTSKEEQSFKFVSRTDTRSGVIILIRKDQRDVISIDADFATEGNYNVATAVFDLTEGSRYSLTIVSASSQFYDRVTNDKGEIESIECVEHALSEDENLIHVVYRDTVLCTDQTEFNRYNIQEGEYKEADTTDNEYAIVNN